MRKYLVWLIVKVIIAIFLFIAHICVANLLPFPANRIHVILISAMWLLLFSKHHLLPYIFFLSLLSELFLSTPFGINTAALIASLIVLDWTIMNILTNRFVGIVFIAGLFGVASYRLIFFAILLVLDFLGLSNPIIDRSVLLNALIESLVNAGALIILYLFSLLFVKRVNPRYLQSASQPYE